MGDTEAYYRKKLFEQNREADEEQKGMKEKHLHHLYVGDPIPIGDGKVKMLDSESNQDSPNDCIDSTKSSAKVNVSCQLAQTNKQSVSTPDNSSRNLDDQGPFTFLPGK